jgi:non-canonical poly(A) RNA polymerase PAPD5/7
MAIQHIRAVIVAIWPGATIEVFGSFSYGLASPQSDVDIAVQNAVRSADSSPHAVLLLAQALAGLAWIQSVKSLPNTGVPLVTAVTIDNLKIDISFATDKFRYATGTL